MELDPKSPDAIGGLSLDRLKGQLTTTNRISAAAVEILVKFCDGQLTEKACTSAMYTTRGGNTFACFSDEAECGRYRSKSNVLFEFRDTCKPLQ